MKTLLPPGWPRPKGYSNGISARGRMVFTAGVIGWDEEEKLVADDLVGQFRQVLANTLAILAEDDAGGDDDAPVRGHAVGIAFGPRPAGGKETLHAPCSFSRSRAMIIF